MCYAVRLRRPLRHAPRPLDRRPESRRNRKIDQTKIAHRKIGPVVHRWTGAFVATPISAGHVLRRRTPTIPRHRALPKISTFCNCPTAMTMRSHPGTHCLKATIMTLATIARVRSRRGDSRHMGGKTKNMPTNTVRTSTGRTRTANTRGSTRIQTVPNRAPSAAVRPRWPLRCLGLRFSAARPHSAIVLSSKLPRQAPRRSYEPTTRPPR